MVLVLLVVAVGLGERSSLSNCEGEGKIL